MKNTQQDYGNQVRRSNMPFEIISSDYNRRRFNPGNPNEFEFEPVAAVPLTTEENAIAATADDNGIEFETAAANASSAKQKAFSNTPIF
jgi:hypothetical protein